MNKKASLAKVSRRWRAVLVDTPTIWSEIYLGHYYTRPGLVRLHLGRSRPVPHSMASRESLKFALPHVNGIRIRQIFGDALEVPPP